MSSPPEFLVGRTGGFFAFRPAYEAFLWIGRYAPADGGRSTSGSLP